MAFTYITNSPIHGIGVFACQDIPKDSELFLEYPKDYNRYWESNL